MNGRVADLAGGTVRLRSGSGTNTPAIGELEQGTEFSIIAGPECGNYTWWQIELQDGTIGWAAEGTSEQYYLEPLQGESSLQADPSTSDDLQLVSSLDSNAITIDSFNTHWQVEFTSFPTIAFSSDSKTLAIGIAENRQSTVSFWDVVSHEQVGSLHLEGMVTLLAFNPNRQTLAVGAGYNLYLFDLVSNGLIQDADMGQFAYSTRTYANIILNMDFNPDGTLLATGSAGDIDIWDANSLQPINKIETGHTPKETLGGVIVSFSPDGKTIASGGTIGKGEVVLWNASTGQEELVLLRERSAPGVTGLDFTPDGNIIVATFLDGTTRMWNTHSGEEMTILRDTSVDYPRINSMALRNDGRTVITGQDNGLFIWDIFSGLQIGKLEEYSASATTVIFSPSGEFFAATGYSKGKAELYVWRLFLPNPNFELRYSVSDEDIQLSVEHVFEAADGSFSADVSITNGTRIAYGASFAVPQGQVVGGTIEYLLNNQSELPVLMPNVTQKLGSIQFYPDVELHISLSKLGFSSDQERYLRTINALLFLAGLEGIDTFPDNGLLEEFRNLFSSRFWQSWLWRNGVEKILLNSSKYQYINIALLVLQNIREDGDAQIETILDFLDDHPEVAVRFLQERGVQVTIDQVKSDAKSGELLLQLKYLAMDALPVILDFCSAAGILDTPIVEYHNQRETRNHGKTTHVYSRVQI